MIIEEVRGGGEGKAPKKFILEEKLGDAMRYFVNHERRVNQNKSQIVCWTKNKQTYNLMNSSLQ